MDENKRERLERIGYEINKSCGLCAHGSFPGPMSWGTCRKHNYEHQKHTGDARQVSIHKSGCCPDFKGGEWVGVLLQSYVEFTSFKVSKD